MMFSLFRLSFAFPLRYYQINAENCPFLAEKLNIVLMPTIILTKGAHDSRSSRRAC